MNGCTLLCTCRVLIKISAYAFVNDNKKIYKLSFDLWQDKLCELVPFNWEVKHWVHYSLNIVDDRFYAEF
jgi:hypothetical protein